MQNIQRDTKMKIHLKEIRTKKGLTLRQLETLSGVSKAEISYIENDERDPTITTLCMLAKALQVPITDLFSCN